MSSSARTLVLLTFVRIEKVRKHYIDVKTDVELKPA